MDAHRHTHAKNALKPALIITSAFLIAEFIGAIYTNSLTLLADSGHMLTDVAALSLSLAASWFATRRATPQKTFGFYRVEILAALLNGVILVLIALYIFYEAYGPPSESSRSARRLDAGCCLRGTARQSGQRLPFVRRTPATV